MPKRTDFSSILIIGSGPIIIGQACEFDYSGAQACKALREEGYRIVLVNSNPATIMTDPDFADVTYIEPLNVEALSLIIAKEKPDALLPTLGGQTALNLAIELHEKGILKEHGVELIGAQVDAIQRGEDRLLFKECMKEIGLDVAQSELVSELTEAMAAIKQFKGFPLIIRPSFTLGGTGGGIAYNREEYKAIVTQGLDLSPVHQVLIEECLEGWKEYEMEVMRDCKDQCVVICSIENFDPMGVHTGDSITVAPTMTLSDKEFQLMRDASFACIRKIGVETGGSNIQFAINPENGRMVVIEMNPRVSRSSALASKATGFPIAKIAAKLAVGYALDEIGNDITRETPACFEPSIDYVVTKIPRFTFEKFHQSDTTLTSAMKSVGEAMAIGRTFKESLQKALRSMENGVRGLGGGGAFGTRDCPDRAEIQRNLSRPVCERIFYIRYALLSGMTIDEIHSFSRIDPWFLHQIKAIVDLENTLVRAPELTKELLHQAKTYGFSDVQIATIREQSSDEIYALRQSHDIQTTYRLVDTCAGEFAAFTPYYYSSYGAENEVLPSKKEKKIMILGGGPNRIGQGIEFDYCCVHASFALREAGYETVMVNSNPETVSTDYDTSDRLYFEPLTLEDVLEIYRQEQCWGVIVQFGGQTPLNLASSLKAKGIRIIGTSPESIEAAEDRQQFKVILERLGLKQPKNVTVLDEQQAFREAGVIGFPILLRPSFVLGGRGMFVVYNQDELKSVVREALAVAPNKPVLLEKFLENAIELDVDAISDGKHTVIGGMLEHIEQAGVHSGDAAMVLPPHTLSEAMIEQVRSATYALAQELKVLGLMNVQYAIQGDQLYLIEVNPRASRTIPFISKAIGQPLAKLAARIMAGETLEQVGFTEAIKPNFWAVKEAVFPFARFPGSAIALTPEMRSTGEVMGLDTDLGVAYAKTQMAANPPLPEKGKVFISVKDEDKLPSVSIARRLVQLGFSLYSTNGTAKVLEEQGVPVEFVHKLQEGRPNIIDLIKNGDIQMIINTPSGQIPRQDENVIRLEAIRNKVCIMTTLTGAEAAVMGIESLRKKILTVQPIQEYALEVTKG